MVCFTNLKDNRFLFSWPGWFKSLFKWFSLSFNSSKLEIEAWELEREPENLRTFDRDVSVALTLFTTSDFGDTNESLLVLWGTNKKNETKDKTQQIEGDKHKTKFD